MTRTREMKVLCIIMGVSIKNHKNNKSTYEMYKNNTREKNKRSGMRTYKEVGHERVREALICNKLMTNWQKTT